MELSPSVFRGSFRYRVKGTAQGDRNNALAGLLHKEMIRVEFIKFSAYISSKESDNLRTMQSQESRVNR